MHAARLWCALLVLTAVARGPAAAVAAAVVAAAAPARMAQADGTKQSVSKNDPVIPLTGDDWEHVYEPAEDTFLFMDALEKVQALLPGVRPGRAVLGQTGDCLAAARLVAQPANMPISKRAALTRRRYRDAHSNAGDARPARHAPCGHHGGGMWVWVHLRVPREESPRCCASACLHECVAVGVCLRFATLSQAHTRGDSRGASAFARECIRNASKSARARTHTRTTRARTHARTHSHTTPAHGQARPTLRRTLIRTQ